MYFFAPIALCCLLHLYMRNIFIFWLTIFPWNLTLNYSAIILQFDCLGNNDVDCNFDQNFCPNWKASSVRKEFNWARHQGETDTSNTGPHSDHTTGTGKGYYVYINAAPPAQLNDTAFLINNNVINKYGGCFEFWYHMYGENIGTLSLYTTVSIRSVIVLSKMAKQIIK